MNLEVKLIYKYDYRWWKTRGSYPTWRTIPNDLITEFSYPERKLCSSSEFGVGEAGEVSFSFFDSKGLWGAVFQKLVRIVDNFSDWLVVVLLDGEEWFTGVILADGSLSYNTKENIVSFSALDFTALVSSISENTPFCETFQASYKGVNDDGFVELQISDENIKEGLYSVSFEVEEEGANIKVTRQIRILFFDSTPNEEGEQLAYCSAFFEGDNYSPSEDTSCLLCSLSLVPSDIGGEFLSDEALCMVQIGAYHCDSSSIVFNFLRLVSDTYFGRDTNELSVLKNERQQFFLDGLNQREKINFIAPPKEVMLDWKNGSIGFKPARFWFYPSIEGFQGDATGGDNFPLFEVYILKYLQYKERESYSGETRCNFYCECTKRIYRRCFLETEEVLKTKVFYDKDPAVFDVEVEYQTLLSSENITVPTGVSKHFPNGKMILSANTEAEELGIFAEHYSGILEGNKCEYWFKVEESLTYKDILIDWLFINNQQMRFVNNKFVTSSRGTSYKPYHNLKIIALEHFKDDSSLQFADIENRSYDMKDYLNIKNNKALASALVERDNIAIQKVHFLRDCVIERNDIYQLDVGDFFRLVGDSTLHKIYNLSFDLNSELKVVKVKSWVLKNG